MKVFFIICILITFISCFNAEKKAEIKTTYNELSLLKLVRLSAIQPKNVTQKILDSVLATASNDSMVFHKTVNYLAKFYSDPNSSFRNEIFYSKILECQMNSRWFPTLGKAEIVRKFHLLHQNDIGNFANDFEYLAPNGQRKTMYRQDADYLLLFFYNPECDACKQMTGELKNSSVIIKAVLKKKLKVFCIYTDKDLSIWYKHLHEFPLQWIHGRDEEEYLYKNGIYDLKAIPTIYLLNRNKKVILKDCLSIEELERALQ